MKTAIVHDFFSDIGGGERIALNLLKIYPEAELFTLFMDPNVPRLTRPIRQLGSRLHTSPLQKIIRFRNSNNRKPSLARLILRRLPLGFFSVLVWHSSYYWRSLDLSKFDLVIANEFGFNAKLAGIKSPGKVHIAYVHDLPFWLYYRRYRKYCLPQFLVKKSESFDLLGSKVPQLLIANSKFTSGKIKEYYQRNSKVIYPPIPIPPATTLTCRRPEYYLFFSRLDEEKGIRIVIEAFNKLQTKLLIAGVGKLEREMKKIAKSNIKFMGYVNDIALRQIFLKTKAMVFCSNHEGFGMAPVEAMAYGVPVIAFAAGGVKETVIHGKTGVLFDNYSAAGLISAINFFETIKISPMDCFRQAQKFSQVKFKEKIHKCVTELTK